ncbi:DUF4437 domain-containing protein [Rhodococcus sp. Z13]|uniref:DUF4437 domain-containing protein n=1 Tax=Rhodococcus sacchari TaxID=2962047 RepID=A0ACD4DJJ3_9NOCA|nr:DUF4437 domain-containing protein [Rhodococcus sp. Z13]UYP20234.1 DUF4437 domain-containing protein [Rhodococcus sp. Z13]
MKPHVQYRHLTESAWIDLGAGVRCRELNRDEDEGTTISLFEIPAGWSSDETGSGQGDLEVFVLSGELVFGDGTVGAAGSYHCWFSGSGSTVTVRSAGPVTALVQRIPVTSPVRSGEDGVLHTDPEEFPWRGHGQGWNRSEMAVLREDPDTGAQTYALRLPPGWVGRAGQHFHTVSEEAFIVAGDVALEDEPVYTAGSYLFRPPHVVHGARERSETGCFALTWTSGPIDFNYVTVEGPMPVPSGIPRSGGCFGIHSHQIDSENHT